jgi:FlaA1/EpsC-like NDP-sugar epimerase
MKTITNFYNKTNYPKRLVLYFLVYAPIIVFVFWLSYEIRFLSDAKILNESVASNKENTRNFYLNYQRFYALMWILPLKFIILGLGAHYRGVLRYFRLHDAMRVIYSLTIASIIIYFIPSFQNLINKSGEQGASIYAIPHSVVLVDYNLSILMFLGVRVLIRAINERRKIDSTQNKKIKRVVIMGAGAIGEQILIDLLKRKDEGIEPVCFLDDNRQKNGLDIHGIPVLGFPESLVEIKESARISEIIITLPPAAGRRIKEINALAQKAGINTLIIPTVGDLSSGRVTITDLRPVSVEDLLGRAPADLDTIAINELIYGQSVLVTGAGGSIGSEIARQVAHRNPKQLIILDQCEVLLYTIEQELIARGHGDIILPIVADVTDSGRMEDIFKRFNPELVLHAAAHKHVPMMESQPGEALKNNTLGTTLVATLASHYKAKRFILISTDKAVNPTNIMGASKRLAEIAVQSMQQKPGNTTRFIAVRFGNVLGSSGSVIPLFQKQIKAGGPITVTHPEVTRYFMTIPEAVGLVLQSACQGNGGDILVLEMGKPLKVIDVARQLIELSGLKPDIDIEIKIIGLRPGEKMFEEIQHTREEYSPTNNERIFRFTGPTLNYPDLERILKEVNALILKENEICKKGVQQLVPEYNPHL